MVARMDGRNVVTLRACSLIALVVAVHLLAIAPVHAKGTGWSVVGRLANALNKTMEDALDLADRGVTASINDDKRGLANVLNEFDNFEARAASNVFWELDVFERIGSAAKRRLKVAGEKIHSIFGGAREGAADSRAALAVDKDTETGSGLLNPKPLPKTLIATFVQPVGAAATASGSVPTAAIGAAAQGVAGTLNAGTGRTGTATTQNEDGASEEAEVDGYRQALGALEEQEAEQAERDRLRQAEVDGYRQALGALEEQEAERIRLGEVERQRTLAESTSSPVGGIKGMSASTDLKKAVITEPKCRTEGYTIFVKDECWYEVANRANCEVFYHWSSDAVIFRFSDPDRDDAYYVDDEGSPDFLRITWTGECSEGVATGTGVLTWLFGHEWKGELVDGRRHGKWILYDRNRHPELRMKGNYTQGKRDGIWYKTGGWGERGVCITTLRFVSGELEEVVEASGCWERQVPPMYE